MLLLLSVLQGSVPEAPERSHSPVHLSMGGRGEKMGAERKNNNKITVFSRITYAKLTALSHDHSKS